MANHYISFAFLQVKT